MRKPAAAGVHKRLGLKGALETAGHRVTLASPNEDLGRGEIDEREERTMQRDYCDRRYPGLRRAGQPAARPASSTGSAAMHPIERSAPRLETADPA